jgi:hypothetical protein
LPVIQAAKQKGIRVALSKPCFELWLLLHHVDESAVPPDGNCDGMIEALRARLGEYNKTSLKGQHFRPESVTEAIRRGDSRSGQLAIRHSGYEQQSPLSTLGCNPRGDAVVSTSDVRTTGGRRLVILVIQFGLGIHRNFQHHVSLP